MITKDYPWHMWATRLEIAGYEPTPMGFEKLLSDFSGARRLDRELQSKGLCSREIDDLQKIKGALPSAPAAELMNFMDMLNLLYASRITLSDLRELIGLQEFCRKEGIRPTAASFRRLLESRESLRRSNEGIVAAAERLVEIVEEDYVKREE